MNHLSIGQKLFIYLQHCLPQHALSRLAGKLAHSQQSWLKDRLIKLFIRRFNVDMSEADQSNPESYKSFNDFFTRKLKADLRPVDTDSQAICSPADGCVSQVGPIDSGRIFQAKGKSFSLHDLLGQRKKHVDNYINGQFVTIYLSPRDYHRVHMPCDGELLRSTYIPGKLFSVNDTTAQGVDGLFSRNERLVCEFSTEHGPMAMVLVGAMIVAGIETIWKDYSIERDINIKTETTFRPLPLKKGDEMGRFKLGSTVILVFGEQAVNWQQHLKAGSPLKMGEKIATTTTAASTGDPR